MSLFKLVFSVAMLGVIVFFGLLGYALWQEYHPPVAKKPAQAIIVLGAQVQPDGAPSVQLERRLVAALSAYQANPVPIVVCGAQGTNEPATEASVMRDWLIRRGVPAADISIEETSFNTKQNIANAIAMLPEGTRDVLIVTSDYHLARAMQVARDAGLEPSGIGSPIKQEYWIKNHARETLAWGKYFLGKFIPLE